MGGSRLTQWISAGYPDMELARLCLLYELQPGRRANLGTGISAWADTDDLDPKLDPSLESGDGDDPVAIGDQRDGHIDRLVGAYGVDHPVYATRGNVTDPLQQSVTVSHRLGAESTKVGVARRARRADDTRAGVGGELDRHETDAARRSVYNHGVAGADAGDVERVRGSCPSQKEPAGLLEGERRWLVYDTRGRHDDLGGIGTVDWVRDDLVADVDRTRWPLGIATYCAHDAGRLVAQMNRQLGCVFAVGAAVHLVVDGVGARRPYLDQDLSRFRIPYGLVDDGQNLRPTESSSDHSGCHTYLNGCRFPAIPPLPTGS